MTISKSELRRLLRLRPGSVDGARLRAEDGALTDKLLSLPEFAAAGTVMLYWGTGGEISTAPIVEAALGAGKTVALPRVTGPGTMEAVRLRSIGELVPGAFGIPEPGGGEIVGPEEFDLILVPGAAFTRDGRRLGRGGGYYDRYLPLTRGLKAALARGIQLLEDLPTCPHDIPLDIIITP